MPKPYKYTKELLEPIVIKSISIAEVLRELRLKPTGGNHRHIKGLILFFSIDMSHFKGQLWSKGLSKEDHPSIRGWGLKNRLSDEEVFSINTRPSRSKVILRRFKERNVEKLCSICGISKWMDKPLTLHLDHINGDCTDNRFENLRLLCPNCHQQTPTWGNSRGLKKPM